MTRTLKIAIGSQDLSAAMSIVAVLIAAGLTKSGYVWWGIGVLAGLVMLAGGFDLLRRGLKKRAHAIAAAYIAAGTYARRRGMKVASYDNRLAANRAPLT